MFKKPTNNQGSALLMSILMLAGALVVVMLSADIIQSGLKMSRTQAGSVKAYYAAEAGAERVLNKVMGAGNYNFTGCEDDDCLDLEEDILVCADSCEDATYTLGDGRYFVKIYGVTGGISFVSTGRSGEARRSIQLSFGADLPEKSCVDECASGSFGCSENNYYRWECKLADSGCYEQDFIENCSAEGKVCEMQAGSPVCVMPCCPFFGLFEEIVFPCEFCL